MKKERSRYVFGAALSGIAFLAGAGSPFVGLADKANAALSTAAMFTFESNGGTLSGSSTSVTASAGSLFGPFSADVGTGTAYASHVSTSGYSSPAGNGSAHSLSSTGWAVGDYYQFGVPTTGISGIMVSFSQTSSGTGPDQFQLQYSLDGTSYSNFSTYNIPANSGSTVGFGGPAVTQTLLQFSFDLSTVTGLNNDSAAIFRLADNSTLSYNDIANTAGTTGTTPAAATGTDRVDDFTVTGTSVPEPAGVSLLTAAASLTLLRRRNSK